MGKLEVTTIVSYEDKKMQVVQLEELFAQACNSYGRGVTRYASEAFMTSPEYALSLGHRQLHGVHTVGNILRNPSAAPTKAIKRHFGLADELNSFVVDREVKAMFLLRKEITREVVLSRSVKGGLDRAAKMTSEQKVHHSVTQAELLYGMLDDVFVRRLMRRLGLDIDEVSRVLISTHYRTLTR